MRDHFQVHQWHDPTAQLTALLVPPPDGAITALAEAMTAVMATEPHIRVIPAQWRHITLTTLSRATDANDQQLTTLAEELAEGLAVAAHSAHGRPSAVPSMIVAGGCRIGTTGISMPIIDGPVLGAYSFLIAHEATRAGVLPDPALASTPTTPHLGLAYGIADANVQIPIPPTLLARTATWQPDQILLVDLHQDHQAGYYTWTTRAHAAIPPH